MRRAALGRLGERMEIRPLVATDAPAIHQSLLGDPAVAAWFRSSGPFTLAECEEMVVRKLAHRAAHGFGWSLGWEGDTCVGWGIAQYCIVDGFSKLGMTYDKSFPFSGEPHVLYRKPLVALATVL
jgi:Acetyltransferase (GNAT) domain